MTIWKPILIPEKAFTPYGKDILPITVLNGAIAPRTYILGEDIGVFKSWGALSTDWNYNSLPSGVYTTDVAGSKIDQPDLPSSVANVNSCLFIHFRSLHNNPNFRIMFLMYAPNGVSRELWVNMNRSSWSGWKKIQFAE